MFSLHKHFFSGLTLSQSSIHLASASPTPIVSVLLSSSSLPAPMSSLASEDRGQSDPGECNRKTRLSCLSSICTYLSCARFSSRPFFASLCLLARRALFVCLATNETQHIPLLINNTLRQSLRPRLSHLVSRANDLSPVEPSPARSPSL
jgi:hypothetical protein